MNLDGSLSNYKSCLLKIYSLKEKGTCLLIQNNCEIKTLKRKK